MQDTLHCHCSKFTAGDLICRETSFQHFRWRWSSGRENPVFFRKLHHWVHTCYIDHDPCVSHLPDTPPGLDHNFSMETPAWVHKLAMTINSLQQVTIVLLTKGINAKNENLKRKRKVEGKGRGKERKRKRKKEERKGGKGNWKWSFGRNGKNRKRPSRESNPGPQQTRLMLYHWATETSDITS